MIGADPEFDAAIALIDRIGAMLEGKPPSVQGTVLTGLVGRFLTTYGDTEAKRVELLATYVQTLEIYLANLETRQ